MKILTNNQPSAIMFFRFSTCCLSMRLELRMQQVMPRLEFVNQCWLWSERMTSEAQKTIYCGSRSPPFLLTMIVGMHFNWGTVFSSDNGGVFSLRQLLAFFIGIDDATRKHFVLRNNITIGNLISSIRLLLVFLKILTQTSIHSGVAHAHTPSV